MELILKQDEFKHLPEHSCYNNNQYKHTDKGYIILEKCHDDDNCQSFYLLENGQEIFLGDSESDGFDGRGGLIKIDFKKEYT